MTNLNNIFKTPLVETAEGVCDLRSYDNIIVMFSGGKDSLACLLWAIEHGLEDRLQLWHQSVDGQSINDRSGFIDWECTGAYCCAIADHFGVPIRFQYREGGFLGEALRDNEPTAPVYFQDDQGDWIKTGGNGKANTRLKFPQVTANLSTRWCSSYLKIDVAATAMRNLSEFDGKRTLVLTGERREESAARAKYKQFEPHRSHSVGKRTDRHVDHLRPVIDWKEEDIWYMISDYAITPHPAYQLGWSRCSCKGCIFLNADGFASMRKLSSEQFEYMAIVEDQFGHTLKRKINLRDLAAKGVPYVQLNDPNLDGVKLQATCKDWFLPIQTSPWQLPAGAFGDASCGPS